MKWPVIGFLLKKAGVFGVKRGKADVAALKEAMRILRGVENLLMFPEGTRVKDEGASEARTGAAMFATRTGAPLLPVYIRQQKRAFSRSVVVIGEPYYPNFAGRKPTAEELDAITQELMEHLRRLMDFLLPHFGEVGKCALVIAVGCTGGRHRSVAVTHALCEYIQGLGYAAGENHRDMTRA